MPNQSMFPLSSTLLADATQTQSGSSSNLTLPTADSYRLMLITQTVSGTTPKLDLSVATSFDGGTTYVEVLQFDQVTTTGASKQLMFRPYLGENEVASHGTAGVIGGTDLAAGTAVALNGPIDPRYVKLRWQISGTTPSFEFAVGYIASPAGRN